MHRCPECNARCSCNEGELTDGESCTHCDDADGDTAEDQRLDDPRHVPYSNLRKP